MLVQFDHLDFGTIGPKNRDGGWVYEEGVGGICTDVVLELLLPLLLARARENS
jgi:hypothetical protein